MNITILGAGAWGTALAISLANRHNVVLWGRNGDAMRDAVTHRENIAYLPGFPLPEALTVTSNFDTAVTHAAPADALLIAAASVIGLRPLAQQLHSRPIPNIVWLCKGLEDQTRLL